MTLYTPEAYGRLMNAEVEKTQKEAAGPNLRCYFGVYSKRIKPCKQDLNKVSRCLGQVSNRDPPEYQHYCLSRIYR